MVAFVGEIATEDRVGTTGAVAVPVNGITTGDPIPVKDIVREPLEKVPAAVGLKVTVTIQV